MLNKGRSKQAKPLRQIPKYQETNHPHVSNICVDQQPDGPDLETSLKKAETVPGS